MYFNCMVTSCNSAKVIFHPEKDFSGPDGFSHWHCREFAGELNPVTTFVFNLSMKSQTVPGIWKLANITASSQGILPDFFELVTPYRL